MNDGRHDSRERDWTRSDFLLALGLAVVTALVFGRALGCAFVGYDDPTYVTDNEMVLRGLSGEGLLWSLVTFHGSTWLPLTWLSHMTDVSLFGTDPAGHHGSSVLLHALNAALAFLVLTRLTGWRWPALAAAALWALHPLRVESVVWVASRKDLVSGTLFLLTLWTWQRWTERPQPARYALCALCLILGLAAKQVLVTVPCLLLVLDVWPLERYRRHPWSRLIVEKLPLFALAVAASIVAQRSQAPALAADLVDPALPLGERLATAVAAYGSYLWQTVAPFGLSVSYPLPTGLASGLAFGALAVATGLALRLRRRAPALLIGWLWFLGLLVPMLGLVRFGVIQPHADRFTYLAQLGLFTGLAFGLAHGLRADATRFAGVLVVAFALFFAGRSWQQIGVWRDDETLWRHALACGETTTAHLNLAEERRRVGELEEAVEHTRRALVLDPEDAKALGLLGALLAQTGHPEEAESFLLRAIEATPRDVPARVNYATLLVGQGRSEEAIRTFDGALEIQPDNTLLRQQYASLLGALGRYGEGAAVLAPVARGPEPTPEVLFEHGRLLAAAGRWPGAIRSLRGALELRPDWIEVLEVLAPVQERAGRNEAAAQTRARLRALGAGR